MKNVAVLVAIGVDQDGYRQVLGVCEGAKEDKESWRQFLRHLKERGLKGVQAGHQRQVPGLVEVLGEFYPGGGLAALHGALVSQRRLHRPEGKSKRSDGNAEGNSCS